MCVRLMPPTHSASGQSQHGPPSIDQTAGLANVGHCWPNRWQNCWSSLSRQDGRACTHASVAVVVVERSSSLISSVRHEKHLLRLHYRINTDTSPLALCALSRDAQANMADGDDGVWTPVSGEWRTYLMDTTQWLCVCVCVCVCVRVCAGCLHCVAMVDASYAASC
jgi:hypothetical protein